MITPATFTCDPATNRYWPANKQAARQANELKTLTLTEEQLRWILLKGIPVTYPNGEKIDLSVFA